MIGLRPQSKLVVRAQANNNKNKNIGERRRLLEQVRQTNLKHVNGDLEKIMKREVDFTKRLVEELVPVKITWKNEWRKDANGWISSFMDALPFKVEMTESPFKAHTVKSVKMTGEDVVVVGEDEAIEPEVSLDGPIA